MAENQESEDKKVVMSSATDSSIKPSDNTRMAPAQQDEIVDPMKTRDTETGKMKRVELGINSDPTKSRRTIKLKPLIKPGTATSQIGKAASEDSEETVAMDRKSLKPEQAAEEPSQTSEQPAAVAEDDTVQLEKRRSLKAEETSKPASIPTPSVPGIRQTIKLRPSSTVTPSPVPGTPETEAGESPGVSPSKPTLKLTPAAEGEASQRPEDEPTVAMPKKTIRLVPKKTGEESAGTPPPAAPVSIAETPPQPSVSTVKLPAEEAAAPVSEEKPLPSSTKKTLRLKTTKHPTGTASAVSQPSQPSQPPEEAPAGAAEQQLETAPSVEEEKEVASKPESVEPGIIFTLAACATFFVLAYFAWMVIGQYGEQYFKWKSANVPGLSGKVK